MNLKNVKMIIFNRFYNLIIHAEEEEEEKHLDPCSMVGKLYNDSK